MNDGTHRVILHSALFNFITSLYVRLSICIPESASEGPQILNRKTEKENVDRNKGSAIF